MKDKILRIAAGGLLATLSSCGIYSSQFDCKPDKGLGCTSAWEVNDLIIENSNDEDPYDSSEHLFNVKSKGK